MKGSRSAYRRQYYLANREHTLSVNRAYRERNLLRVKRVLKLWYAANVEDQRAKARIRTSKRAKDFPEKAAAASARRRAIQRTSEPAWANHFFIKEAYALAALRNKVTGIRWAVDHIVPLKNKIVSGLHVETNLRVIPFIDNASKGNRWWPDMP